MYSEKMMSLFAEPHNVGIIQNASGIGQFVNENTHEVYKLYLKIENEAILNASFKVYGGVASIAVMSQFTEMLKNLPIQDASNIKPEDILKNSGVDDKEFAYLANDALDTLNLAIEDYKKKLQKELEKQQKSK